MTTATTRPSHHRTVLSLVPNVELAAGLDDQPYPGDPADADREASRPEASVERRQRDHTEQRRVARLLAVLEMKHRGRDQESDDGCGDGEQIAGKGRLRRQRSRLSAWPMLVGRGHNEEVAGPVRSSLACVRRRG